MLFTSILCGVDFSGHSARALRCAATLAVRQRARLTAITVLDPLLLEAAAAAYDLEALSEDTKADLARFVAESLGSDRAGLETALKVVTGTPAREILRSAETLRADLIVLGTHGLGGMKKAFFGSTTDRVLRDGGLAVLVVPFPEGAPPGDPLARPTAVFAAVALDRDSSLLVRAAASLARDFAIGLTLVHVLEPLQLPPRLRRDGTDDQGSRLARAERQLAVLAAAVPADVHPTTLVRSGEPAEEIGLAAGPDGLIVIGLGRPTGIGHRPGSTAYRMVCSSSRPVLALPETD